MNTLAIIGIAFVLGFTPGIFWLWFFYKRDKIEPEPKSLVIKVYILGIAVAIPVLLVQIPFLGLPSAILAIVFAPIVEEFFKYFAVRKTVYTFKEFDEPMDGIVYAAAIALGFASIENFFYLYEAIVGDNLWGVFFLRALLTVPGHVLFSAMWGYALGMTKFSDDSPVKKRKIVRRGVILSMVLHSVFNVCAVIFPIGAVGLLVVVPVFWIMLHKRIKTALKISPHLHVLENSEAFDIHIHHKE
jgi:RsiW-degrading membrane proteinase PrsW (M82 family)